MGRTIDCPGCTKELKRSSLTSLGSEPAWIAYATEGGKRHLKRRLLQPIGGAHSAFDVRTSPPWYPDTPVAADREMYIRCALQLKDIESIADFYTARNLEALALLWEAVMAVP